MCLLEVVTLTTETASTLALALFMPLFKIEFERTECLIHITNFLTVIYLISRNIRLFRIWFMGDKLRLNSFYVALVRM